MENVSMVNNMTGGEGEVEVVALSLGPMLFFGTLCTSIFVSNLLVLVVCIVERNGILDDYRYVFLACVSASDAAIGLLSAIRLTLDVTGWCTILYAFTFMNLVGSPLCLVVATLHQYIVISRPLHYMEIVTRGRVVAVVSAIWCFAAAMFIWVLLDHPSPVPCLGMQAKTSPQKIVQIFFVIILPLVVNTVVYTKIFFIVRSHRLVMDVQRIPRGPVDPSTAATSSAMADNDSKRMQRKNDRQAGEEAMKEEVKSAINLLIVPAVFMIMWAPYHCILFISTFDEEYALEIYNVNIGVLGTLNHLVNPIIYAFRFETFRKAYRKLLCRCF